VSGRGHRSSRLSRSTAIRPGLPQHQGVAIALHLAERLHDIVQKLRCWGYLSHCSDAERDVAWLLDQLAERDARVPELEVRLQRNEWAYSIP
jgi:hypothetical protein